MLDLLKYQAEFILKNVNIPEIQKDKEESKEFLLMLNDLDLTLTDYLNAENKYQLTDETKKIISESKELKEQLKRKSEEFSIEDLFVDRLGRGGARNC